MSTERSCEVVDSIDCEAAPDQGAPASKLATCWGCGDDVCRSCSSVIAYRWKGQRRRMRFCFNCQDQRKIGRAEVTAPEAQWKRTAAEERTRAHAIMSNLARHGIFNGPVRE